MFRSGGPALSSCRQERVTKAMIAESVRQGAAEGKLALRPGAADLLALLQRAGCCFKRCSEHCVRSGGGYALSADTCTRRRGGGANRWRW